MKAINPNSKQAQGLIGHWNFEDGDVRDLVGRHANGSATSYVKEKDAGSATKGNGSIPSVQFDGTQKLTLSYY